MSLFGSKKTAAVPTSRGEGVDPSRPLPPLPAMTSRPSSGRPSGSGGRDEARAEAVAEAARLRSERRADVHRDVIATVDLEQLATMEPLEARKMLAESCGAVIAGGRDDIEIDEREALIIDIVNDILGLGPLEVLLERDDIADIMINGPKTVFIEVKGKLQKTDVEFRDTEHLTQVCQRIANRVGRRVDESSPICDARLLDGSRVAILGKPLALDGPCMTIRKFRRDKLTLDELVQFGSITRQGANLLELASNVKCNILISGGTGSGKTTLLNCLTRYIESDESIITCEDAAELQLQQPNVRRWETRPSNSEGKGEVKMEELVKAALRHRPDRIIIGEVRGPEAFDLLQAMNTGHDGSMGTVHSNSPREAIGRFSSLIAMGGKGIPPKAVLEQIGSSIDLIVQASRMRDGSRKITHITEVCGMEEDVVVLQDLMLLEQEMGSGGKMKYTHRMTGVPPRRFMDKARQAGRENELVRAMERTP